MSDLDTGARRSSVVLRVRYRSFRLFPSSIDHLQTRRYSWAMYKARLSGTGFNRHSCTTYGLMSGGVLLAWILTSWLSTWLYCRARPLAPHAWRELSADPRSRRSIRCASFAIQNPEDPTIVLFSTSFRIRPENYTSQVSPSTAARRTLSRTSGFPVVMDWEQLMTIVTDLAPDPIQ